MAEVVTTFKQSTGEFARGGPVRREEMGKVFADGVPVGDVVRVEGKSVIVDFKVEDKASRVLREAHVKAGLAYIQSRYSRTWLPAGAWGRLWPGDRMGFPHALLNDWRRTPTMLFDAEQGAGKLPWVC